MFLGAKSSTFQRVFTRSGKSLTISSFSLFLLFLFLVLCIFRFPSPFTWCCLVFSSFLFGGFAVFPSPFGGVGLPSPPGATFSLSSVGWCCFPFPPLNNIKFPLPVVLWVEKKSSSTTQQKRGETATPPKERTKKEHEKCKMKNDEKEKNDERQKRKKKRSKIFCLFFAFLFCHFCHCLIS